MRNARVNRLNLLESVLLGLLARRSSAGYDIRKYLEKSGRIYGYVPQSSQIYRQLARLVERGLLAFDIDRSRSGPDAKVYSLTGRGWRAFLDWVDAPFVPSARPLDAHFQVHFTLAGAVSPVVALRLVETELAFRLDQEADWDPEGRLLGASPERHSWRSGPTSSHTSAMPAATSSPARTSPGSARQLAGFVVASSARGRSGRIPHGGGFARSSHSPRTVTMCKVLIVTVWE